MRSMEQQLDEPDNIAAYICMSHNTAVLMVIIAIKCGLCLSLAPDKSLVLGIGVLMHDFN